MNTNIFVSATFVLASLALGMPQASPTRTSSPVSSSLATVPPLSTEADFIPVNLMSTTLSASFGPPDPSIYQPFDNPSPAQYTAFQSAKSLATAINSTVPFAQPTEYTLVNLFSYDQEARRPLSAYRDICPSGFVGVGNRCCPGVAIGTECFVTNTSPIASYPTFTGKQHYPPLPNTGDDNSAYGSTSGSLSLALGAAISALLAGAALL